MQDTAKPLPLNGLRVIDSTYMFAGPYAGAILADLGAEVIKVEGPARLDFTRGGAFSGLMADNEAGRDPWNRTSTYNLLNRGKKSLVLDLSKPEGREVLVDLMKVSDIFIDNFTPRVMRGWGLDFPNLKKINPRLILITNTGYGHTGPYAAYPAQATTQEATHGLAAVTGYRGGEPSKAGQSYVDFVAAWACAMGAMLALRYRNRFDRSTWIDVGMYQLGCFNIGEYLMDWMTNGTPSQRIGNRHRQFAPQGVYRCAGDDAWCAVSVRDDDDWAALTATIARPDLAAAYPTIEARRAAHDEIDRAISAWAAERTKFEAMETLQAAGVPAGAVLDGRDLHLDPQIRARGLLEDMPFPPEREMGSRRPVIGRPWKFSGMAPKVSQPGPVFGQHNTEILRDTLGYDAARIAELEAQDIVTTTPRWKRTPSEMSLDERVRVGRLAYWDPDYKARLGIEDMKEGDQQ